jgi:chromate transporter
MTDQQFLDGLALAGAIPAPLIVFGTFVGSVGGGPAGALAMTFGMFLPAFAMTLAGHRALEAVVANGRLHAVLDGVAAAVVGIVATTTLQLANSALTTSAAVLIFGIALVALYVWKAPWSVVAVIAGAALLGIALLR